MIDQQIATWIGLFLCAFGGLGLALFMLLLAAISGRWVQWERRQ